MTLCRSERCDHRRYMLTTSLALSAAAAVRLDVIRIHIDADAAQDPRKGRCSWEKYRSMETLGWGAVNTAVQARGAAPRVKADGRVSRLVTAATTTTSSLQSSSRIATQVSRPTATKCRSPGFIQAWSWRESDDSNFHELPPTAVLTGTGSWLSQYQMQSRRRGTS